VKCICLFFKLLSQQSKQLVETLMVFILSPKMRECVRMFEVRMEFACLLTEPGRVTINAQPISMQVSSVFRTLLIL